MITANIKNISITAIACAVPTRLVKNVDYYSLFGKEIVDKIIASTGIESSFHVHEKQTAGDLAFAAANYLLKEQDIDPKTIGALVFVGTYPDYFAPSTASVIQKRLGISNSCIVFDINLACSGFILGLQTISSLLQNSSAKRALLVLGDTTSKVISPMDKSRLLFGDAGACILIEKDEFAEDMNFGVRSDGDRFKAIIVPAGGFRHKTANRELKLNPDGNTRSDYNLLMNGTDVFSFTMSDVPTLIKDFLNYHNYQISDFDAAIFHQPNAFILTHLAKKLKLPLEKMPMSLRSYGNTSGVSIPVTLCHHYSNEKNKKVRLLFSGFGVGLSWGVATSYLNPENILPIINTDEYYEDGLC